MAKKNEYTEPVETETAEETEAKEYATVAERIAASIVDSQPGKPAVLVQFETVSPNLTNGTPSGDIRFCIQAENGMMVTGILNRYSKKAKMSLLVPQ